MKTKRILSILLVLTMALSLFSVTAFAADQVKNFSSAEGGATDTIELTVGQTLAIIFKNPINANVKYTISNNNTDGVLSDSLPLDTGVLAHNGSTRFEVMALKPGNVAITFECTDQGYANYTGTLTVIVKSAASAEPVFDLAIDGTAVTKDNFASYVKGTTKVGDYTFAGWFDGATEFTGTYDAATAGTTYTAKWTNAKGKTVLTEPLIITKDGMYTGGTYKDGAYNNDGVQLSNTNDYGISLTSDSNGEPTLTLTNAAIIAKPIETPVKYSGKNALAVIAPDKSVKNLKINSTDSVITVKPGDYSDETVFAIETEEAKCTISGKLTVDISGVKADICNAISAGAELNFADSSSTTIKSGESVTEGHGVKMPGTLNLSAAELNIVGGKGKAVWGVHAAKVNMEKGSALNITKDESLSASNYKAIATAQIPNPDVILSDSTITADGDISCLKVSLTGASMVTVNGALVATITPDTAAVINGTKAVKGYTQTDPSKPIVVCLAPMFDPCNGEKIIMGEAGKLPTQPVWEGFTFAGWFAPGAATAVEAGDVVDGVTYTAKWENASGKTVLTEPLAVTTDGLYVGGTVENGTYKKDGKKLEDGSAYGISLVSKTNNDVEIALDHASIVAEPVAMNTEDPVIGPFYNDCNLFSVLFTDPTIETLTISSTDSTVAVKPGDYNECKDLTRDNAVFAIYAKGQLVIKGTGLTADASGVSTNTSAGIAAGSVKADATKIIAKGGNYVNSVGLWAKDMLTLSADASVPGQKCTLDAYTGNADLNIVAVYTEKLSIDGNVALTTHKDDTATGYSCALFVANTGEDAVSIKGPAVLSLNGMTYIGCDGDFGTLTIDGDAYISVMGDLCAALKPDTAVVVNGTKAPEGFYKQSDTSKPIVVCLAPIFDAGNGEIIIGEEGKLPEENPTWDGYTFDGWYKDKDFTQKLIAEDVKVGDTYFAKWTNNKSGKTVLIQPITVKEDGLHLGDTPADNTALSQYGIKFTPAENDNPAILELDGATIMSPAKYAHYSANSRADGIYAQIFTDSYPLEIAVKSESNIISNGFTKEYNGGVELTSIYMPKTPLTISGTTLNITTDGKNAVKESFCIKCGSEMVIGGNAVVNVNACNAERAYCIRSSDSLTVKDDAVLTANAKNATESARSIYGENVIICDNAVVTANAKNATRSAYGIYGEKVIICDNAVVTAKSEGKGIYSNGINVTGEGEALVIGGNAVVKTYGGNGTDEWYGIWSNGSVIIKENATVYAYGGLNPASGEKEAMYIESKKNLYLRDNAQLIADGSLPFGKERSVIFEGEPCNAFLSAKGDVKAYVTGMVTSVNGNGKFKDDAGFTQKNKNAPIIFTGKQCKVVLEGVDGYKIVTGTLSKPTPDPVKDGYVFGGWFSDKACTKAWNFDTDIVFEDMTLYPKWIKDDTAVEAKNMKLTGGTDDTNCAVVDVYAGDVKIKSVVTDENGNYDLGYLTPGDYTLKITSNGRTVTELLHIEQGYTPADVSLTGKIGTEIEIVESGSDTPHTMVGGLSKLAESYNDGNRSDLSFKVEAQTAESVSVSAKDAITAEISGNKTVAFVDMSIFREYIGGADNGKREPIHNTDTVLEIVMNYDTVKRQNIEVIRYHDGVAEAFEKLETRPMTAFRDGTYFVGNGFIVIYADKFSEYAIGYTQKSSGRSGGGGSLLAGTSSVKTPASVKNGSVSVSPKSPKKGETVTVNTTPDKGYEVDKLTVKDSKGNLIDVTDAGNGKYTFTMPDSTVSVDVTFKKIDSEPQTTDKENGLAFDDVKESDWFYNQVKYVYDNNLMMGISNTEFAPNMPVTRAMFVTVLYRMEGEPEVTNENVFTDVKSGEYYEKAVIWAQGNEIVKGISETEYAPNTNITREQMAAIIYRYACFKGIDTESVMENTNTLSHNDIFKVSDWAKEAMNYCIAAGIITGDNNGNLNPQNNATRAEFATILMRAADIIK